MTINFPGVEVQFASANGSTRALAAPNTYFVAGYAEWGPINTPVFLSDKRQLGQYFGAPTAYGWLTRDLQHFFDAANGTGRAWAVRGFELGTDATSGAPLTADAYTAKATLSAAGAEVLQVSATYPGALGNTFKVDVIKDNTTGVAKVTLWGRGAPIVITWANNRDSVLNQIANINANAAVGVSDFTVALAGTFVAGGPDATSTARALFAPSTGAVTLQGGSDGASQNYPLSALIGKVDPDTGKPTGLEVLADQQFGPGMVAIPGYAVTLQQTEALNLHAQLFQRLALVSLIPSANGIMRPQDAVALKNTLSASSYVSYYYPQVYDLDGVLSPLEGYVAGLASRNQAGIGVDGGIKASVTGPIPITGVLQIGDRDPVTDGGAELLYADAVNYVRNVRGVGYRVESQLLSAAMGAISRVHHRVITLKFWYDITEILNTFRDRTIDSTGKLQSDIKFRLDEYLGPYQPGKFPPKGNTFYNAAVVVTDNSIQNAADLEQGLLHVLIEGSFTPKAERISLLFNVNPIVI